MSDAIFDFRPGRYFVCAFWKVIRVTRTGDMLGMLYRDQLETVWRFKWRHRWYDDQDPTDEKNVYELVIRTDDDEDAIAANLMSSWEHDPPSVTVIEPARIIWIRSADPEYAFDVVTSQDFAKIETLTKGGSA